MPAEGWVLAYDRSSGDYIGQTFDRSLFPEVGVWQDLKFLTMEVGGHAWTLAPGERREFTIGYRVGRGRLDDAVAALRAGSLKP